MTPQKDNIKRMMYCARKFLDSKMSVKTAADLKEIHGIVLDPDATNKDALDAVVLKKAREGDPEYIEAAKKYGLLPDGESNE